MIETNRTNNVVTPNPKVIVAAIGIRYWACKDFSNINADNPPMVVQEVNKTGLSLSHTPDIIASLGLSGFFVRQMLDAWRMRAPREPRG